MNKEGRIALLNAKRGSQPRQEGHPQAPEQFTGGSIGFASGEMAAANESSEAQEATWKEQALLLHDKRISHQLEMLHTIVDRTNDNILGLKKHLQEHKYDSDEKEFDAEELLAQERSKRQRLNMRWSLTCSTSKRVFGHRRLEL
ncbi:hypothetical protein DVH05_018795 [Phytophthora capsici]|nr:hypothetical protein DVH05_018795 [Phytophthora capsici]